MENKVMLNAISLLVQFIGVVLIATWYMKTVARDKDSSKKKPSAVLYSIGIALVLLGWVAMLICTIKCAMDKK